MIRRCSRPAAIGAIGSLEAFLVLAVALGGCAEIDGQIDPGESTAARPVSRPGPLMRGPASLPRDASGDRVLDFRTLDLQTLYRTPAGRGVGVVRSSTAPPLVGKGGTGPNDKGLGHPGPPVTQRAAVVRGASADTDVDFDSTDFDTNGVHASGFRFIPPDAHGAVGPNHLVNVTNVTLRVHDKAGTLLADLSLRDFFLPLSPLTFTFDPKVLYDAYEDRFVLLSLEVFEGDPGVEDDESRILLAVSSSGDPLGSWALLPIPGEFEFSRQCPDQGTVLAPHWSDYPGFALDDEVLYVTVNQFTYRDDASCTSGGNAGLFGGVRMWVIDKGVVGGLYDPMGVSASGYSLDPLEAPAFPLTLQPADVPALNGQRDAPDNGTFLVSYGSLTLGLNEVLQVVRFSDPLLGGVVDVQYVTFGNLEAAFGSMPAMPQSGSVLGLASGDRRTLDAVWRGDLLHVTTTVVPDAALPGEAGQATAAWVAVDTSNPSSLAFADGALFGGEDVAVGTATAFASVAVNADGSVVVGFSGSSPTTFGSSYFSVRRAGASDFGPTLVLREGLDVYERTFGTPRNRWGDYSSVAVDPVDGCFWIYNQHAIARGSQINSEDGRWGTAWGRRCVLPLGIFTDGFESGDTSLWQ